MTHHTDKPAKPVQPNQSDPSQGVRTNPNGNPADADQDRTNDGRDDASKNGGDAHPIVTDENGNTKAPKNS